MRLIDGDALEKFLSDAEMEATKRKKYVLAGALNMIQGNVRNFPTIEPEPRWISCKERLPESFQEVLVCGDNGAMDIIIGFTVDGIDDRWIWQMSPKLLFVKEIVAWQPLPEKFKEEGGEE